MDDVIKKAYKEFLIQTQHSIAEKNLIHVIDHLKKKKKLKTTLENAGVVTDKRRPQYCGNHGDECHDASYDD